MINVNSEAIVREKYLAILKAIECYATAISGLIFCKIHVRVLC